MRRALLSALFMTAALAGSAAAQTVDPKASELRQKFIGSLESTSAGLEGVMGYSIVDLTSGDRVERLPSAVFATASTIKLAILYELFRQSDEGRLSLDTVVPFDQTRAVGGTVPGD